MPVKTLNAAVLGLLLGTAGFAAGQNVTPFKLSEALTTDSIRLSSKRPVLGGARGLATEVITVTSLDDVKLDAVGILPASVVGLPSNFWGDSDPDGLAQKLRPHKANALPAVTALMHHILLAELEVPIGHSQDGNMLLARLDHLLAAGALDQAEALLDLTGTPNAALFRRWFDISLLTGRAERACAAMLGDPGLTPTFQARVFCLFRSGDWAAAALTLRSAGSLGKINKNDAILLAMFLDPELYAGEPDPPAPKHLTPLIFTMREALALPRTGQSLPLAYLQGDLQNYAGWRHRLAAAERLVRAQSISSTLLIEAFNESRASASGGVWDRVRSVQALRAALAGHDSQELSAALPKAYNALALAGLEYVLADMVFPRINDIELTGMAASVRFKLALLHQNRAQLAARFSSKSPSDRFLVALAQGKLSSAQPTTDMQEAVSAALSGSGLRHPLLDNVATGRQGHAVLKALDMLSDNRLNDPQAVETALAVLVAAGLQSEATDIAIQLLTLSRQDLI